MDCCDILLKHLDIIVQSGLGSLSHGFVAKPISFSSQVLSMVELKSHGKSHDPVINPHISASDSAVCTYRLIK